MNFAELNSAVQEIVHRPDLASRIEKAVRDAILKTHTATFWTRDIVEIAVQFNSPNVLTSFSPRDIFTRFRKIAYIRLWNYDSGDSVNYGRPGKLLDHSDIGDILDYWGFPKTDLYYEAGDLIQIRTSSQLEYTLMGAYQYPKIVAGEEIISWIARDYPSAIIYEAAAKIFAQIGHTAMMQSCTQEAGAQLVILNQENSSMPAIPSYGQGN